MYKSSLATIIDRDAGPIEQSRLMVDLLTEAGYTAGFVHGEIRLTKSEIEQLLGTDDSIDANTTENVLTASRIPFTATYSMGVLDYVDMEHVWVSVEISATTYQFDPSFKTHSYTAGINIGTAMGWDGSSLAALESAADPNTSHLPDYVTDFQTSDLNDAFVGLAGELLTTLNSGHFDAGMAQIIGGRSIDPLSGTPLRQTSLPYLKPDTTPETWSEIPDDYRAILQVMVDDIDEERYSDDIYGSRLTVTFNESGQVELKLAGSLIATGSTSFDEGAWLAIGFSVTHPFCEENVCGLNDTWSLSVQVGSTYLIGNAWGASSQSMVDYHRTLLQENKAAGGGDTDEDVLGESLAVYWSMRRAQNDQVNDIYDQVGTAQHYLFHFIGLMGYSPDSETPSWDIGSTAIVVKSRNGDSAVEARISAATDLLSNGLEASVLQQSLPITGINAMQMLTAAAPTQKIIDASSSNWSTGAHVKDLLTNWDDSSLATMDNQIAGGSRLIIHEDGATTIGDFVGGGWYEIGSDGVIYSWLQGEVEAAMLLRTASSPIRTMQFVAYQTRTYYFNGPPTCTWELNLPAVLVWYGTCLESDPVYFASQEWGAGEGCPNIKRENLAQPAGTSAYQVDTWGYYAWPLGLLSLSPAHQSNGTSSGTVSASDMSSGASNTPGSADIDTGGPNGSSCSCDPVSLYSGEFQYERMDMSVGSGGYPFSLQFNRFYSSGQRLTDGPLGFGWTHNFANSLNADSNAVRALGELSPKEAAAAIAHCFMLLQIDLPSCGLVDFLITTTTTQWLMDQLSDNAIHVEEEGNARTFLKLLDGTYNPMLGYAESLVKNEDDSYTLSNPQQLTWNFDSDGVLQSFVHPAGMTVSYTYSTGKLMSVSNGLGRTLTFAYTGDRLLSVSDDNDRSVSFDVDVDGNLTEFTDAESKTITYAYDSPGLLTQVFLPANPLDAYVTNEYDSLYRVMTQVPANEGTSTFYFAGGRSELVDPLDNSEINYFNSVGSPLKEIDALGNATVSEFDGLNRLISKTMPESNAVLLEYANTSVLASNNVLTKTWQAKPGSSLSDVVQHFEYDPDWNKVSSFTDGESNTTEFEYDETQGTVLTISPPEIDSMQPTIVFTYDDKGRMLTRTQKVSQPESPDPPTFLVDSFDYDDETEVLLEAHRDPEGLNLTSVFGYNAWGDVNSIVDPVAYALDPIDPYKTTFEFDNERRMVKRTECAPFEFETNFIHNDNGELITLQRETGEVDPEFQEWNWEYNVHGDVVTVIDPAGKELNFEYDSLRRLQSRTDAEDREWQFDYDPDSRISTVTDPMNNVSETRAYTDNGMVATIIDARSNTTEMTFDGFDRLDTRTYPDSTFEQFTYNQNSQVETVLTRAGDTITNTFDVLTRLSTRAPGSLPTQTMGYDLTGRLLQVSTPAVEGDPSSGNFGFGYDTAGRLTSQTSPTGEDPPEYREVGYELDENGNRTKLTWPDTYYAQYFLDELNRLTDIKLNGSGSAALHFDYDDLSRRTGLTYINGCSTSYGYAINNDLTNLEHSFVGSSVSFAYSFNDVHQLTGQTVSDADFIWKPSADETISYGTANELNQYPTVDSTSYGYDDNGNLTSGPFSATFDELNRPTQIINGATNNYWNDPLNRQAQKEVNSTKTGYLFDGAQLIAEYNSGGSLVNRYIPGSGIDDILIQIVGGTTTYLHQDRLGSTVAQANSSGAVLNKYAYSPFGETASLSGTIFGFTGQRYDAEIGLYNYKARYYSPAVGRFLQPDPLGYAGGDMNLQGYVGNDPTNFTDPLGLAACHDKCILEFFSNLLGVRQLAGIVTIGASWVPVVPKTDTGFVPLRAGGASSRTSILTRALRDVPGMRAKGKGLWTPMPLNWKAGTRSPGTAIARWTGWLGVLLLLPDLRQLNLCLQDCTPFEQPADIVPISIAFGTIIDDGGTIIDDGAYGTVDDGAEEDGSSGSICEC